jgi:hypothetical protein
MSTSRRGPCLGVEAQAVLCNLVDTLVENRSKDGPFLGDLPAAAEKLNISVGELLSLFSGVVRPVGQVLPHQPRELPLLRGISPVASCVR